MKPNSFREFSHLLRFSFNSSIFGNQQWMIVFLGACSFILILNLSHIQTASLSDLFVLESTAQLKMWYFFGLSIFLNNQGFDPQKNPSRILGGSEFVFIQPISLKALFYSRIVTLILLMGIPSLCSFLVALVSPNLQISGKPNEISLLEMIHREVVCSRSVDSTNLLIPHGSWILTQFELLTPLSIILVTLCSYYFLRKKEGVYGIGIRGGVPTFFALFAGCFFIFSSFVFKKVLLQVQIFLWFYHWRYWVLGGLILALIALILFLGEKAEAREEF